MIDLLIVALAGAFAVTAVERWFDLGWVRGLLAFAVATGGILVFEYEGWKALLMAMATAFLTLVLVLVGERLASPPPVVIDRPRRQVL